MNRIKLSERLQKIADLCIEYESAADIGTDHAYIPAYLYEHGVCKIIASDVNRGPLSKAGINLKDIDCEFDWDLRLGSGLEVLENGEVEAVVIAGMGSDLIIEMLEKDLKKSLSFKAFILQPRKDSSELRKWLVNNNFVIVDELLAKEDRRNCQIIKAVPLAFAEGCTAEVFDRELDYHIPPMLIENRDPLMKEFFAHKIDQAELIVSELAKSKEASEEYAYWQQRLKDTCTRKKEYENV